MLRYDEACKAHLLCGRSSGAVYLKEMEVEVSGMSCASFNSEEGFGSPAARFNRERQNVFDLDDNEIKVS